MADPKPAKESLSKTPSWIMLGFVVGCIVALTVKRDLDARHRTTALPVDPQPKSSPAQLEVVPAPKPARADLSLTDMEAIFLRWQVKAVWRHELTQVAYWNPTTNQYSGFVEVLRSGEDLFFRTIPHLTRPLINQGVDPAVPILFTELDETRAARRTPLIVPSP